MSAHVLLKLLNELRKRNRSILVHVFSGRLFVFVALRPMSTAMVIAGRSVHLTTLFLGRLEQAVNK